MRTIILNEEVAKLAATCCELAYEQSGLYHVPEGFRYVQGFQAVSIDTKEWFGFVIESEEFVIVAFRGTQSDTNWIADSLINQRPYPYVSHSGEVHNGFLSIYQSCRDTIIDTLQQLSPEKTLLVTGHSLGGALAILHVLDAKMNTHFSNCVLYNFGAPKVGDLAFCNFYNMQVPHSFRFVNLFDIVPLLPPSKIKLQKIAEKEWKYFHVQNHISFTKNLGSVVKNHIMESYINVVSNWKR